MFVPTFLSDLSVKQSLLPYTQSILNAQDKQSEKKDGSGKEKTLVAVLDLKVTGGLSANEAATLSARLRTEISQTGKFEVIERGDMESILKEQDFSMSDLSECATTQCAVEIGQLLNAEQLVLGSIGKVGKTYSIDVRLVDVSSGKIVKTSKQDYAGGKSELVQVIRNIARIIAGKKPKKIKKDSNKWYWILGVLVAAGGAAAAYVVLDEDDGGVSSFSEPPDLPDDQ